MPTPSKFERPEFRSRYIKLLSKTGSQGACNTALKCSAYNVRQARKRYPDFDQDVIDAVHDFHLEQIDQVISTVKPHVKSVLKVSWKTDADGNPLLDEDGMKISAMSPQEINQAMSAIEKMRPQPQNLPQPLFNQTLVADNMDVLDMSKIPNAELRRMKEVFDRAKPADDGDGFDVV